MTDEQLKSIADSIVANPEFRRRLVWYIAVDIMKYCGLVALGFGFCWVLAVLISAVLNLKD